VLLASVPIALAGLALTWFVRPSNHNHNATRGLVWQIAL
jgi:hypothetical protein